METKYYIHLTDGTRDGADKIVDISDTKSPTCNSNKWNNNDK